MNCVRVASRCSRNGISDLLVWFGFDTMPPRWDAMGWPGKMVVQCLDRISKSVERAVHTIPL